MRLEHFLHKDRTVVLSGVASTAELVKELAGVASGFGIDAAALEEALTAREEQMPTSTPEGVAFPHALLEGVSETSVIAVRIPDGVVMGKSDHPPADIVFCMIGAADKPWDHVRLLARLARIARGPGALDRLRKATDAAAFYEALVEEDRSHG